MMVSDEKVPRMEARTTAVPAATVANQGEPASRPGTATLPAAAAGAPQPADTDGVPTPELRSRSGRRASRFLAQAAVVLCVLAGCIEAELVPCSNGRSCPVGALCDEIHLTCVSPDQLTVCDGLAEGADCSAGPVTGGCFDGVCLARGCGNRVVETGEMCDDGNQTPLDGCRGDCLSTEVCGNGFVDPGESCDGGDLISRDGCDSRCQVEDSAWSMIPLIPAYLERHRTAYDAARGRLLSVDTTGDTWEWDGTRWRADSSLKTLPYSVFYDPDHGEVRMISSDSSALLPDHVDFHVRAWRDGKWVQVSQGDGPNAAYGYISVYGTHDAGRHRLIAIDFRLDEPSRMWTLDSTDTWTQLVEEYPGPPWSPVMASDPATGQLIVETSLMEWVYDGTGWTSSFTDFMTPSIAHDASRGRLVLIDDRRILYERVGTEWRPIPDAEVPCRDGRWQDSPLYYNTVAAALDLVSTDGTEICRWNGGWTSVVPDVPSRIMGASYDPVGRSFVLLHNAHPHDPDAPAETWALSGESWSRLEISRAPAGRRDSVAIYSPGRAATVLYGGFTPFQCGEFGQVECQLLVDAWNLDDSTWSPIAAPPLSNPFALSDAAYDAKGRRVVVSAGNELWTLGDRDSEWMGLDTDPLALQLVDIAWDSRNEALLAARMIPGWFAWQLFDLRDDVWTPIALIPDAFARPNAQIILTSDERSGGVFTLDTLNGSSWLRLGSSWHELPPVPLPLRSWWAAYNPVDGSLLVVGDTSSGRFAAILTRESATPLESCVSGEDLDGDGLAGCDDPECYWACSSCLPYTTCR